MKALQTRYPVVFVHGMFGWGDSEGINRKAPYWGGTTGSITEYLSERGVECYAASDGPISSAWDQACELYAQLTGTRVDYGEHHAGVYGHKRFGRTYSKPIFEDWSEEKKVHLIGHSFGGHVIRLLAHLLENGSPDEIALGKDDISPLFVGGHKNLICSISAICSPLNGTEAYKTVLKYHLLPWLRFFSFNSAIALGRTKLQGSLIDVHLEQMGVNTTEDVIDKKKYLDATKDLFKCKESIDYDMTDKGTEELNGLIRIVPSVYYFSYPFSLLGKNLKGETVPSETNTPLLRATGKLMIKMDKELNREIIGNDGLIDVNSAKHPKDEPFRHYNPDEPIEAGLWNVMPTGKGDHGTPIGLFADKEETHKFYDDMIALLNVVENKGDNVAKEVSE